MELMRGRTSIRASVVISAVLVTALTGCGGDSTNGGDAPVAGDGGQSNAGPSQMDADCQALENTEPIDVTFGIPSDVVEYTPWQFGVEEGLFEEQGINLEIQQNIKPATLVSAVIANSIDVDAASGGLMVAALEGAPVKRFMDTQQSSLQALYVDPNIEEISDLKGQKIAITALGGSISESVLKVLQQEGIDTAGDVEMIATGTLANSLAALQAGQVAGAVVSAPLDVLATNRGFKELFVVNDYVPGSPVGLGTSVQQLEEERDKFLRLVDASLDAIQYVRDNEGAAVDWIASHYELSADDAQAVYDRVVPTYVEVDRPRADAEAVLNELTSSDHPNPTEEDLAKVTDYSLVESVLACRESA